jgi:hypothetical protein
MNLRVNPRKLTRIFGMTTITSSSQMAIPQESNLKAKFVKSLNGSDPWTNDLAFGIMGDPYRACLSPSGGESNGKSLKGRWLSGRRRSGRTLSGQSSVKFERRHRKRVSGGCFGVDVRKPREADRLRGMRV